MIGVTEEIGITNPDMKVGDSCKYCDDGFVGKAIIENHSAGGFFNALECNVCEHRYNITKFTKEELKKLPAIIEFDSDLRRLKSLRNNLNRKISALKKAEPKLNLNKDGEEIELATCVFCGDTFNSTGIGDSDCGCHDSE